MENYNFDSIPKGSTFGAFSCELTEDGVRLNIVDGCVQLKKNAKGAAVHTFAHEINDGVFDVPEQILDVPPYNYVYDIRLKTEDGQVFTSQPGIVPITQNVSECQ